MFHWLTRRDQPPAGSVLGRRDDARQRRGPGFARGKLSYRAILTSAASKFPPKIVLPVVVGASWGGFATLPPGSASTPAGAARVLFGADRLAAALSNEYGGPLVVVAASTTLPPLTATPAPSSKPVPPQVTASSSFFPVGARWSTKASWEPAPKLVVVPAT